MLRIICANTAEGTPEHQTLKVEQNRNVCYTSAMTDLYDDSNIFAKLIAGEEKCKKVYEDSEVLAFNDISPVAPVHVLVIPKGRFRSFHDFALNFPDVGRFFQKVRDIAESLGLAENGYRIVMNHNSDGGQMVFHFHAHIIGGTRLGKMA